MGPALAAAGALVAALIEITIASRFQVAGAELHILFVFAVVLAVSVGFEEAMAWAFIGGLAVDLLAGRLLGSTVFALVATAGTAAVLGRTLSRSRLLGPVVAAFLLTAVYSTLLYVVTNVFRSPAAAPDWRGLLASSVVSAIAAAVFALPVAIWQKRQQDRIRVVW